MGPRDSPRVRQVEPRVQVEVPHQIGLPAAVFLVTVAGATHKAPSRSRRRRCSSGYARERRRYPGLRSLISHSCGRRSAMRSIKVRDFESTPGQLYCRRSDPERISTRRGRSDVGSLPFSSLGFIYSPWMDCSLRILWIVYASVASLEF